MISLMMCGVVIGLGLWVAIFPQRLRPILHGVTHGTRRSQTWMNRRTGERHKADLAIMNRIAADMVVRKLLSGLFGFGIVVILLALGAKVGVAVPVTPVMVIGAMAAIAGFIMPDQMLRASATARRRNFLHAFSSYLDLTNVLLAGGAGTETALVAAADAGDGWAFDEVRHALVRARSGRRSPWNELSLLGHRFNLPEVIEVAGSVQLAGEHGARIRTSLAAKADSLRHRQMGDIEAQAQSATERMGVPMVILFISFIALIGYPAMTMIVGNL